MVVAVLLATANNTATTTVNQKLLLQLIGS
jgi:hypothetical protein